MELVMDCHKQKTLTLVLDINDWHNFNNDDGNALTMAQPSGGYYGYHFAAYFGNISVRIQFVRELDFQMDGIHVTVDAHVTTSIDSTETETITQVTAYVCQYSDPEYYSWDYSMTGQITIELDSMHLWQTWLRQAQDTGHPASDWGYPQFPYHQVGYDSFYHLWLKSNLYTGGATTGNEMSTAAYYWCYGGTGDYGSTTVTIGGSITVDGTEVTISDTGTIGTGDPHYLDLQCDIWNNYNGGADTSCTTSYTAVLQGTGVDLPYNMAGVTWSPNPNPDWYYGINCTVDGDADGTLTVENEGYTEDGIMQVTPVVHIVVQSFPELHVAANGRIHHIGALPWADDATYPPVKIRPLWRSYDVPPALWYGQHFETAPEMPFFDPILGASIELTGGAYSGSLTLQRINLMAYFRSRNDGQASDWKYPYFRQEHQVGVVLEQSSADYDGTGADHWLADAHQHNDAWRVMSQDAWLIKPAKVRHTENGTLPDSYISAANWDITGADSIQGNVPAVGDLTIVAGSSGAKLTKTFNAITDQWSLSEFRYLQFAASAGANCNLTWEFTFEVGTYDEFGTPHWTWADHTKAWTVALTTADLLCELDLVAPDTTSDGTSAEYDTTDWSHDKTTGADDVDVRSPGQIASPSDDGIDDDEVAYAPYHLFGIGRVTQVEISIPANQTVRFLGSQTALRLHVKYMQASNETDRATLTVLPAMQLSDTQGAEHRWTRNWFGTWEVDPDWWKFHPEGKRLAMALVNYKQSLDLPYAHFSEGGYRCTAFPHMADILTWWDKNAGQDWTLTDLYDDDDDNPNRLISAYPAMALSPCKWSGSTCTPVRDVDVFSAAYELEARLPCDIIYVAPGAGDPQGSATAYPYYFYAELGGLMQGITHSKTTRKALPGAQVTMTRGATALPGLTSNLWSYYRSLPLYTVASDCAHTVTSSQMAAPVDLTQWNRMQWCSLIGALPSVGGRPDITYHKPTGRLMAVTKRADGLALHISENHGQSWVTSAIADTTGDTQAAVAVPQGTSSLHGIWVASVTSGGSLVCRTTGDNGGAWAVATIDTGVSAVAPALRWNETRGILSCTYCKDGSTYLVESIDHGVTWGTPTEILNTESGGSLAAINTNALLVFAHADSEGNLVIKHTGDRGGTWT